MQHTGEKKHNFQDEKNIDEITNTVSSFHYIKSFYKIIIGNYINRYIIIWRDYSYEI